MKYLIVSFVCKMFEVSFSFWVLWNKKTFKLKSVFLFFKNYFTVYSTMKFSPVLKEDIIV